MSAALRSVHVPTDRLVTGVQDPVRLAAVAEAGLHGHVGDDDLTAIVESLRIACRVPIAVVNIVSPGLQTYPAEVGVGVACTTVPDGLSFCAEVVETGDTVVVADARTHPVYADNPLVVAGAIRAYAGVPLIDRGAVLGSVSVFDSEPREFTEDELQLLTLQAGLAAAVLSLRRTSRTDWLTGLANRAVMGDRLVTALARLDRHPGLVGVLFVDVDGFKQINDTLGHEMGDQLLMALAERLNEALRPSDTLARYGGDEFVVVCDDLVDMQDACTVAERLISWVRRGLSVGGRDMDVEISVGVAVTGSGSQDPEVILRQADEAMYRAKAMPGSHYATSIDMVSHLRPVAADTIELRTASEA